MLSMSDIFVLLTRCQYKSSLHYPFDDEWKNLQTIWDDLKDTLVTLNIEPIAFSGNLVSEYLFTYSLKYTTQFEEIVLQHFLKHIKNTNISINDCIINEKEFIQNFMHYMDDEISIAFRYKPNFRRFTGNITEKTVQYKLEYMMLPVEIKLQTNTFRVETSRVLSESSSSNSLS